VRYGDFDIDSGYWQMHSLLESGVGFSAVFVASDTLAYGAKAALRERGLNVPQDIAMVGFDDLPFSRFTDPPLTSVRLPAVDLAREAADMLLHLLRGEEPERKQLILDTQLVVRQSCGTPSSGSMLAE
jgi:LacI family transcriptional regulator